MTWTSTDIPDLTGRTALVTGGSSGLGRETALALARHGARVVLTARDEGRAKSTAEQIAAEAAGADVIGLELDLGDLVQVQAGAAQVARLGQVDILVNNAGIMAPPHRLSPQGIESQLAINHLGHFALTAHLLPVLRDGARVVTVSSAAHRAARLDFDDPASARRYSRWRAYGRSKLANLLFAFELDRRLRAAGMPVASLAAHPGHAESNLRAHMSLVDRAIGAGLGMVMGQSTADGALPQLRAAVDPAAQGGQLYGPGGRLGMRGAPVLQQGSTAAHDADLAVEVWETSLRLTGVTFEALADR